MKIGRHTIGQGHPCFVIAEVGVNHNGDPEYARRLVDVAAAAGADAVKFQSFTADNLTMDDSKDMLKRYELPVKVMIDLKHYAESLGLIYLCTPFDEANADVLEMIGVVAYKVASGELINHPLLKHIALKGMPMILSTGMATMGEIHRAREAIYAGNPDVKMALLHCTSCYPAMPHDCNLRALKTMQKRWHGVPIGYSDHTEGYTAGIAAVAMGARIIEKHITLDRNMAGPDHQASLEPAQFTEYVRQIRLTEKMLGSSEKIPVASELNTRAVSRKSLYAARDLHPGDTLTLDSLIARRPGHGIYPCFIDSLIGRTVKAHAYKGELITERHLHEKDSVH